MLCAACCVVLHCLTLCALLCALLYMLCAVPHCLVLCAVLCHAAARCVLCCTVLPHSVCCAASCRVPCALCCVQTPWEASQRSQLQLTSPPANRWGADCMRVRAHGILSLSGPVLWAVAWHPLGVGDCIQCQFAFLKAGAVIMKCVSSGRTPATPLPHS